MSTTIKVGVAKNRQGSTYMQFGILPKNVSEVEVAESLSKLALPGEEFVFTCKVNRNLKTEIFAISNLGLLIVSSKDLQKISKRVDLTNVNKLKFSWVNLEVGVEGENSPWILGVDKADSQSLKSLPQITQILNSPNLKKKETLDERISRWSTESEENSQQKRNKGVHTDVLKTCGNVNWSGKFAKKQIKIFENAYVAVDGKEPERLISVDGTADVTKKSGPGRVVGTVATTMVGGIGPAYNNRRGDVYLTLNTEKATYSLSLDLKNAHSAENPVQVMNEIVATCKRLIAMRDQVNVKSEVTVSTNDIDLPAQLEKLSLLRNSGALSEQEFEAAKAKLLDF